MKKRIPYWFTLFIICLPSSPAAADDRLILNARINGEYVRLAYDTGFSVPLVIFKQTVERLGLNVAEEGGYSIANLELEIDIEKFDAQALVIDFPPLPDVEGVVGYPALRDELWRVQWDNMTLSQIPKLPNDIFFWHVFDLDTLLPIAAAYIQEDSEGLVYVDTGDPGGISLSDSRWNKELAEKPNIPITLKSGYTPAAGGIYVTNIRWSDHFQIGPLRISCVMVSKSVTQLPNMEAGLGLEALKHYEVIFDLTKYKLYLKDRPYHLEGVNYNRLGATFPPLSLESDDLVGHVLENSPAYKAGLRSGDILLRIDNHDMTKWRSDPTLLKRGFFSAEAGTKYALEVERDGRKHIITVVLENILEIPDRLNCGQNYNKHMQ